MFPKGLAKRIKNEDGSFHFELTVAGVLLLAKLPTTFLPGARIRFIRYEGRQAQTGTEMNIVRQQLIEKPLSALLDEIGDVVEAQLRTFSSLNLETGKFSSIPEYPKGAWIEGIVNAVAHRSYNYTGDDIRVIMFDDRLEIHSPGGLPAVVTPQNIRKTHYSRNPYIARALTDFGWVKEFGEGVDRIYKDMADYFLDDPIYKVDGNSVELVLKNNIVMRSMRKDNALQKRIGDQWHSLSIVEREAVSVAYEKGSVRTRDLTNTENTYSASTVRRALQNLASLGILDRIAVAKTSPNQFYRLRK